MLGQSIFDTKLAARNTQISLSIFDSFQTTGSAEAKIINHHLMKSVKQGVTWQQTKTKEIERVRNDDTFIMTRYLGFPELTSKQHYSVTEEYRYDPQAWHINNKPECFIC